MILNFTRRTLEPDMTALVMQGSIHCGPECARLEREVDGLIAARQTRVIFDMAGVTHAGRVGASLLSAEYADGKAIRGSGHYDLIPSGDRTANKKLQHELDFWLKGKYRKKKPASK